MASAEIFNINTNQNQFSDNNTMDLNLDEIKMFESLDLNGSSSSSGAGGSAGTGGNNSGNCSSNSSIHGGANGCDNNSSGIGSGILGDISANNSGSNDALMDGALEDTQSMCDESERDCKICKKTLETPRVLACLHVFCESCLDTLLIDESGGDSRNCNIICSICKQPTAIGPNGVSSLHTDYVLTNILDLNAIEPGTLACTSCKSKENAMSRCNDCANFLCASCDNAHKYMRCFENHKVVLLDELRNSKEKVVIHKPLFCQTHSSENLKYYCFSCHVPVCNDCLIADHKGADHPYELIGDAEKRIRPDIEELMHNAQAKVVYYDTAVGNLNNSLNELQSQHDSARELIENNYKSFKHILDKCREKSLKDLERLHSERELNIMDSLHSVEKMVERVEETCKFTTKVLQQSNGAELLSLKKLICNQIIYLMTNTPKTDLNYSLEFDAKFEKFEVLAQDTFGKFRTESSHSPKESTPPPTLPGMPPMLNKSNGNSSQGALTASVTASSPISLPTSMQSSFDGDMLGSNFMLPSNVMSSEPPQMMSNAIVGVSPVSSGVSGNSVGVPIIGGAGASNNMTCLSSIAEYNLHRLANLADVGADMTDNIVPSSNPSPSPQFTINDLISGDQRAFNSLQALAKLGMNSNGNPGLNRGPSPGLDGVSMLNDFVNIPGATSPIGNMSSMNEDMSMRIGSSLGMSGRTKATPMQIRCKFGSLGASKAQFNSPHGFCLGVEEEIIVADTNNHRIEVFEKNGTFKFQFGVPGKEEGQLWYPRKVAVMRTNSKFVVCDRGNERSRMQIFTKNGHFIKKIAIRYIDIVAGLAVTNQGHIVAVDSVSPTVFIISEDGELVHWFDCSDYMREPSDIAISGSDFYVCDFKGHCVAVFKEDGTFQHRIGHEKITCFPNGIDISDAGDILIGDSHGNRFHVACFSRDGVLQSEFECPYVKVSRCCGLKITSEGYVVTLAKNNHHVLVLNTLYIQ